MRAVLRLRRSYCPRKSASVRGAWPQRARSAPTTLLCECCRCSEFNPFSPGRGFDCLLLRKATFARGKW